MQNRGERACTRNQRVHGGHDLREESAVLGRQRGDDRGDRDAMLDGAPDGNTVRTGEQFGAERRTSLVGRRA